MTGPSETDLTARLAETEAHAVKDLWAGERATDGGRWVAHYGTGLPASSLTAGFVTVAEFRAPGDCPDGDPQHNADAGLAMRAVTRLPGLARRDLRLVAAVRAIARMRDGQPDGDPAVPLSEIMTQLAGIWDE